MRKEEKLEIIEHLTEQLNTNTHVYITDTSGLNAAATSALRRLCFNKDVKMIVVKNTLLKKAMDRAERDFGNINTILTEQSTIMLSEHGNVPAKLIKEFRSGGYKKPNLKGAFVEECVYLGAENLDALVNVKSKNELLGELVTLLQSPAQNVISALQSGGNTIAGIVKTLSEKE